MSIYRKNIPYTGFKKRQIYLLRFLFLSRGFKVTTVILTYRCNLYILGICSLGIENIINICRYLLSITTIDQSKNECIPELLCLSCETKRENST